jgi:hypothetical protein
VAATCNDGITNQNETSTDCGGSCGGCGVGEHCTHDGDCTSLTCQSNQCVNPPVAPLTTVPINQPISTNVPVARSRLVSAASVLTPTLFLAAFIGGLY